MGSCVSSSICNSPKLEITHMSVIRKIDIINYVYTHKIENHLVIKKRSDKCNTMDESKNIILRERSQTQSMFILYYSIFMMLKNRQN